MKKEKEENYLEKEKEKFWTRSSLVRVTEFLTKTN
jgi:hypothetical protein